MKYKTLLIISLLHLTLANAQNFNFNVGGPDKEVYSVQIPFKTVNDFIVIPVNIHGKTYRFKLDTGSSTIISQELYNELKPATVAQSALKDAGGRSRELKVVELPGMSFGDVTFINTMAYVLDINQTIYRCHNLDGVIGSNLFYKSVVQIDKANKSLIIASQLPQTQYQNQSYLPLTLTKNQSLPIINLLVGDKVQKSLKVLFDTGSSTLLEVADNKYGIGRIFKVSKILAHATGSSTTGFYGNAPVHQSRLLMLQKVKVHQTTLPEVIAKTTLNDNSLLGMALLNYGKITLEYAQKRFYFEPYPNCLQILNPVWGISFSSFENRLVIGYVWDEQLKNQIAYGNKVLEINGIEIKDMDVCQLREQNLLTTGHSQLELKVTASDGTIRSITVKKIETQEN